ncbi:hypothetical protein FDECE_15869 [Fusarium decemcellulare]|nr:hypothetical protein FDECE_15869 [Fusarium decemcellulare]
MEPSAEAGNLLPGTVALVDTVHDKRSTKEEKDIILHPRPSDDPGDPLLTCSRIRQTWTGPAFAVWNQELDISTTDLNNGVAILVFMCGVGIMFMQPWALKFGRRAPYLIGSIIMLVALVFGATMTSVHFYYAFSIMAGFGTSPSFCVTETSLLDVTFLHQRGRVLSIYSLSIGLGTFLSPVAAGAIIQAQNWRWCFYYLLLLVGLASVLVALGSPETLFIRQTDGVPPVPATAGTEIAPVSCKENTCIKSAPDPVHLEPVLSGSATPRLRQSAMARHISSLTLFRRDTANQVPFLKLIWGPLRLLQLPAVAWMSLMLSVQSFWVNLIITTQAAFFSVPPYNFTSSQLGLTNFALIIGAIFGCVWGGILTDRLIIYKSRQRRGVSEAEDRLWMYAVVPLGVAGGVILYGVGAFYGLHWTGPCFGLVLIGFAIAALLPISQGYALDSYPKLAGETIQVSNVLHNVIGGGLSFAIAPWINRSGAKNASIAIAMLGFALNSLFVLFLWKGKDMRRCTKGTYLRLINGAVE